MKVVLEHVSGTAKNNLQRARVEMNRVLYFRGSVTSVKAKGPRIIVEFSMKSMHRMGNFTGLIGSYSCHTDRGRKIWVERRLSSSHQP
jgi:hypothetical protein